MKRPLWNLVSSLKYNCCSSSNVLKCGVLKQPRVFSESDITEYSKQTLDHNPLHFDPECAREAGFSDVPVPGLAVASLFPRIIASHFEWAVYVKQSLEFKAPVFVGDEIIGEVRAINIRQVKRKFMVNFETNCLKNGGAVVIRARGEATALLPTLPNHFSTCKIPLIHTPGVRQNSRQNFFIGNPIMKRPFWNLVLSLKYSCCSSSNVLKCGDVLKQARVFSESDITEYSKLTLDHNPLHFDAQCAREAGFSDIPVPGLAVASLFPRIIASHFEGAVYVKQSLEFKAPVFVGDEIIGEVRAINIRQVKHKFMVKFETNCLKNGGAVVISGEATALLPTLDLKHNNR